MSYSLLVFICQQILALTLVASLGGTSQSTFKNPNPTTQGIHLPNQSQTSLVDLVQSLPDPQKNKINFKIRQFLQANQEAILRSFKSEEESKKIREKLLLELQPFLVAEKQKYERLVEHENQQVFFSFSEAIKRDWLIALGFVSGFALVLSRIGNNKGSPTKHIFLSVGGFLLALGGGIAFIHRNFDTLSSSTGLSQSERLEFYQAQVEGASHALQTLQELIEESKDH